MTEQLDSFMVLGLVSRVVPMGLGVFRGEGTEQCNC